MAEQTIDPVVTGPRFLDEPAGAAELGGLTWTATDAFVVGDYHLGVRSGSTATADVVRRVLRAHHVADVTPPANFSVVAGGLGLADAEPANVLYRGARTVVRSDSAGRVIRALVNHLAAFLPVDPTPGVLRLAAVALVRDGHAAIAPANAAPSLPAIEQGLNAAGVRVVDQPWAWVDCARLELVVPPPPLQLDLAALENVDADLGCTPGGDGSGVLPGRYPLSGVGLGVGAAAVGDVSRGLAVTELASWLMAPKDHGAQQSLEAVARLLDRVPTTTFSWQRDDELLAPLLSLV